MPSLAFERLGADDDLRHVAHIDRPSVPGRDQQQADVGDAAQGLAGIDGNRLVVVADAAGRGMSGW